MFKINKVVKHRCSPVCFLNLAAPCRDTLAPAIQEISCDVTLKINQQPPLPALPCAGLHQPCCRSHRRPDLGTAAHLIQGGFEVISSFPGGCYWPFDEQ